jgi:hypothetical protein
MPGHPRPSSLKWNTQEDAHHIGAALGLLVQPLDGIITTHHFCLTRCVTLPVRPYRRQALGPDAARGRASAVASGICAEGVRDAEAAGDGPVGVSTRMGLGARRGLALPAGDAAAAGVRRAFGRRRGAGR